MATKIANNAKTTLASGIDNVQTTITVATGQGALFPVVVAPDVSWLTIRDATNLEIDKVIGRSGDTFTLVRGQDGTSAYAFDIGAIVEGRLNVACLDGLFADVSAALTALVDAEESTRAGADAALNSAISSLSAALSAETSARSSADTALQTEISGLGGGGGGGGGALGLGIGQAWTDVSSSRARSVVYQNTTANPIMVSITQNFDASIAWNCSASVGVSSSTTMGVVSAGASFGSGTMTGNLVFVVPPGHYYKYTTSQAPTSWGGHSGLAWYELS